MCDERLAWLETRLAEAPGRPTMIFLHHPPFATGIEHMDRIGLDGADRMAEIVVRYPNVERVLCGHLHRSIEARWAGTLARTAPSTAHQVALDLREGAPGTFIMEPAAFLLHIWQEGVGVVTHTSYVGDFPGPFLFREPERQAVAG
jgi:3',5'-cyclic AMP phosphodiesterase CpdA